MSSKEITNNTAATWRGIKKFYKVTVGVVEASAWLGLLATAYTIIYCAFKDYIQLNDIILVGLITAAVVITFRLAYEGAKYFRDLGNQYEN